MVNKKIASSLLVLGVLITLISSVLLFAVLPRIVHNKIAEELYLAENRTNEAAKKFQNLPITMTYSAWVFEIDDTEFDGIHVNTLNYVKRGPYVWNEKRSRDEIEFEQNENVSFVQKKEFEFNPNRSCEFCHKNDFVHVYNPLHTLPQEFINLFLNSSLSETTKSLIYEERIEKLLITGSEHLMSKSILYWNDDGTHKINTGYSDIDKYYEYVTYNDVDKLDTWRNDLNKNYSTCNILRGTDATQFKPGLTGDETLWMFEPQLCSMFFAKNTMPNVKVKDIDTIRFVIQNENFAKSEENYCKCVEEKHDDCRGGILNIKNCLSANPAEFLVSPGYYYDQPEYLNFTGLSKIIDLKEVTMENYGTILDVEPNTGIVLNAVKRLIFSAKVRPNAVPKLKNLKGPYQWVPIVYLEEAGMVDDDNANQIKDKLRPKKIATALLIVLIIIGLATTLGSIISLIYANK